MVLTEKDFIQDTCKATPGFEYYPKKFLELNVSKLIPILKENDFYISKDNSPFYLHVKKKELEASIFSSAKIIIKNTSVEEDASLFLLDILVCLNKVME
ncbi:MAG: hypothetical protein PHX47_04095 [Candidatus ainarchaeum sp.]|nr:hypothetical protein [Candidatus ainarchaeum sp.]